MSDAPIPYNPALTERARELRRRNTPAEAKLWLHLRRHALGGAKFKRQQPIGPYVADFYSPSARLVIEVDGSQHLEPTAIEYDMERTSYFEGAGLRVLRFTNRQVMVETEDVVSVILRTLTPLP